MANYFLLPRLGHNGDHLRYCFCEQCRGYQYQQIEDARFTTRQLFNFAFEQIHQSEEVKLNQLYRLTLRKIVFGKVYKDACLRNTPYEDFGWWARTQEDFMRLPKPVQEKFCKEVNQIDSVYKDWEDIVSNLTVPNLHHVDARKFSVNQFYRARKPEWCLNYNDIMRGGGQADLVYEEHKYQRILRFIIQSGILDDISHESILTSMLGCRLQRDLMIISRQNRHNI